MDDDTANLELDMLIAERFGGFIEIAYRWYDGTTQRMLWHPDDPPPKGDDFQHLPDGRLCAWGVIPRYSTDIAAAWELIEQLREQGFDWYLTTESQDRDWFVRLTHHIRTDVHVSIRGTSLPMVLCAVALESVKKLGEG